MSINLKNRIFGLDVIRALAILLVLCSHSTLLLFPDNKHILITVIQFFGTVGVDLFFVLSGFLIGTIILKQLQKGHTKFKDFGYFWVRRWFRTLPNYFLILLLNIALLFVLKGEVIHGVSTYFGFLQNFYYGFLMAFLMFYYQSRMIRFKNLFLVFGLLLFIGTHVLIFSFGLQPEHAPVFFNIFYLPLLSISLLLLFPYAVAWNPIRFFKTQFTSISVLSYGVYLVNYSIVLLTLQYFIDISLCSNTVKVLVLIAYWLISFLLAHVLYAFFENPMTNLRDSKYIKRFFNHKLE